MKQVVCSLAFWLGFFLFAVYLLSFSGKLHIMDEYVGYAVAHNLVQHRRADVNQFIWTNHWQPTPPGLWGRDNNLYTKKAPGISLAAAPLIWLGHTLPGVSAVHFGLLLSILVTALTGALLYIWLGDLGISPSPAALTTLLYGLCTIAWIYARLLWEHALMALLFLAAFWGMYRLAYTNPRRPWGWILWISMVMSASLTMRFEAALAVGLIGLALFLYAAPLPNLPSLVRPAAIALWLRQLVVVRVRWLWAGLYAILPLVTLLGLLIFNATRFGSAGETGYNREILFQRPWEGGFGLLFSPSTGMFIYAPVMLLLFGGIRPAWHKYPKPYLGLIWFVTIFYWIFYGSWFSWGSTWVWGPRFLLHTWPLLMLFVAEALLWISGQPLLRRRLWWGAVIVLAAVGFAFNLLGVAVDLNEHFIRLGRNDNYLFNWAAFAPLGHWRILQEGLIDIIWLSPTAPGAVATQRLQVDWQIFGPLLGLLLVAAFGLALAWRAASQGRATIVSHPLTMALAVIVALVCLVTMLRGAARVELSQPQAIADAGLLTVLSTSASYGDSLLIAMPPFGDVQEISTHVMAYLHRPLPTYAWIESEPRAIEPDERERIWQAVRQEAQEVWLFERWLTPTDPLSQSAAFYSQMAFPVEEQWIEQSGKLTHYALAPQESPTSSIPLNVPFQGGLTLVDAAIFNNPVTSDQTVMVRLTWQAAESDEIALLNAGSNNTSVLGFVHLVDELSQQNMAQQDRLLLDTQHPKQSYLLPGQTVQQGYGLRLPQDLPPGSYPLIAGLYLPNGQRLVRTDGSPDDFIYITNITVEVLNNE